MILWNIHTTIAQTSSHGTFSSLKPGERKLSANSFDLLWILRKTQVAYAHIRSLETAVLKPMRPQQFLEQFMSGTQVGTVKWFCTPFCCSSCTKTVFCCHKIYHQVLHRLNGTTEINESLLKHLTYPLLCRYGINFKHLSFTWPLFLTAFNEWRLNSKDF